MLSKTISAIALVASSVSAGACKPVKVLMTRASGSPGTFADGSWSTEYGLSSVNTADVGGALKYVISETIDFDTGYTNDTEDGCHRKNWVSHIHFYEMTVCNSDAALWWFNDREGGVWDDEAAYSYGEFGQYLTFDGGACDGDSIYCNTLHGGFDTPNLGPYVGWQDVSDDPRNPTAGATWYSLPGQCPQSEWQDKTEQCSTNQPSGLCADGVVPDGETCTWSYKMMGQVVLDDLVGITSIVNPATGTNFVDAEEYCMAGNKEFVRDATSYEYVSGLEFWRDPLSQEANGRRIEALMTMFGADPDNIALSDVGALKAENPRCYTSCPDCFDGTQETCTRDNSMLCSPCAEVLGAVCPAVTDTEAAFATVSEVSFAGDTSNGKSGVANSNTDSEDSSASAVAYSFGILCFTLLLSMQ